MKPTRRQSLLVLGALFASPRSYAQVAGKTYRIGSVYLAAATTTRPYEEAFFAGLRDLGFERGRNLSYDVRHCDGDPSRLAGAVDEVIAKKPDLLVGIEQVARIMRNKTATIPIVFPHSPDPVAAGLAATLPRPGGNATGMAALTEVMAVKQIELLRDLLPQVRNVAVLLDPGLPGASNTERFVARGADEMRVQTIFYRARDRQGLSQAFAAMERDRPQAIINASGSGTLFGERRFIADNALRLGLPAVGASMASVEAGNLFSYSASLHGLFRQAASPAARILKGANPAELPVEQPSIFELAVNLKTAKALGIKVPPSILLRADRVIE